MGDLLELAGMACLVAFSATFGLRWFLLAAGIALVLIGLAGGVDLPRFGLRRRREEPPYGVVHGGDL